MNVSDIINYANSFIGDSSTDRLSASERYQAATEATAWLLEELGNEHMVDRAEIEYLPTVTWYKMDALTPYLLGAGNLRMKEDTVGIDFTRVDARELASTYANKYAYAIERYDGDSYLGIVVPKSAQTPYKELVPFSSDDELTYTGTNAANITKLKEYVKFDMDATGQTATGLSTLTSSINLTQYANEGVFVVEVEIPDISDVTSISLRFGTDLATDYYLGTVAQDVGGNTLSQGLNIVKFKWEDLSIVGTPDFTDVTQWQVLVNHDSGKAVTTDLKLSDLRVMKPMLLNFKYIFYRVGKDSTGDPIIEFTSDTDVPFFVDRYPQYKFAVAHKVASVLYRFLQLEDRVRSEDREAQRALDRYRKNFSGERDMPNSAFKIAGINLRRNRIVRRR